MKITVEKMQDLVNDLYSIENNIEQKYDALGSISEVINNDLFNVLKIKDFFNKGDKGLELNVSIDLEDSVSIEINLLNLNINAKYVNYGFLIESKYISNISPIYIRCGTQNHENKFYNYIADSYASYIERQFVDYKKEYRDNETSYPEYQKIIPIIRSQNLSLAIQLHHSIKE